MSINIAVDPASERSTILHSIANNGNALEELGKMLNDIENRLYRPHPIETGKPVPERDETVESLVEGQSDVIREHNETALRIMNRLA